MSFEKGGRADKFGNDYERLWIVNQLLKILNEEVTSLQEEAIGDDEKGVDVWVHLGEKKRIAYQCKSECGQRGKWSIASLKDVLRHSKYQLERDPQVIFSIVSSDDAPILDDLITRSKNCANNSSIFVRSQITTSQGLENGFRAYCQYLSLNEKSPNDQEIAFHLLQRTEFVLFRKRPHAVEELERLAGFLIDGDASLAVSELYSYSVQNIGNTIDVSDIRTHLASIGLRPKTLVADSRLIVKIETQQKNFLNSFGSRLWRDPPLKRVEAKKVFDAVTSTKGPRIVFLFGDAGVGKSGVIYEVSQFLQTEGIVFLPIRLDRQKLTKSTETFGQLQCGLPASPPHCLRPFAKKKPVVLLIDQLDSIRWTSSHSSESMELFVEMIREAMQIPCCKVVVACRRFDMNENRQISEWRSANKNNVFELQIPPISLNEVKKSIIAVGGSPERLSKSQMGFLANFQNLTLWAQAKHEEKLAYDFQTPTDLFSHYWEYIRRECDVDQIPSSDVNRLLSDIVCYMQMNGTQEYPDRMAVKISPKSRDKLLSLNALKLHDSQLSFSHQSQHDFLLVESVADDIANGTMSIFNWLLDQEQSLFCRHQFHLLISVVRDLRPRLFVNQITALLFASEIRFHIKLLVFVFLGNIQRPTEDEVELVWSLLNDRKYCDHVLDNVLVGREAWVQSLDKKGYFDRLLFHHREDLSRKAIWVVRSVQKQWPEKLSQFIRDSIKINGLDCKELKSVLRHQPEWNECKYLFSLRTSSISSGKHYQRSINWNVYRKGNTERIFQLLKHIALNVGSQVAKLGIVPSSCEYRSVIEPHFNDITSIATRIPLKGWFFSSRAIAFLERKSKQNLDNLNEKRVEFQTYYRLRSEINCLLQCASRIQISCGVALLARNFSRFQPFLSKEWKRSTYSQRNILAIFADSSKNISDVAIRWIINRPNSLALESRARVHRFRLLRRFFRRHANCCSRQLCKRLQRMVLAFHDQLAWDRYKKDLQNHSPTVGQWQNEVGFAQYALLSVIKRKRRISDTSRKLDACERKFGTVNWNTGYESRSGSVSSPIPFEVIHHVSDRQWFNIISTDWTVKGQRKWTSPDQLTESSHEQFGIAIGLAAEKNPERFARFACQVPQNAPPRYLTEILWALQRTSPPDSLSAGEKSAWRRPDAETVIRLLRRIGYDHSHELGIRYCNLVRSYDEVVWPQDIVDCLVKYAVDHSHPPVDYDDGGDSDNALRDLDTESINCVRGVAARAIGNLLFESDVLTEQLHQAVVSLSSDGSAAVRVGALSACLPIVNIDKNTAVNFFLKICEAETLKSSILNSHAANLFLKYTLSSHFAQLQHIVLRMKESRADELQEKAAQWIASGWLRDGLFAKQINDCVFGALPLKKGVSAIIANDWKLVDNPIRRKTNSSFDRFLDFFFNVFGLWHRFSAVGISKQFLLGKDPEVRECISRIFRNEEIFDNEYGAELAKFVVQGEAFTHTLDHLTFGLKNIASDLSSQSQLVFSIGERLMQMKKDGLDPLENPSMAEFDVPSLLIRIYHESRVDEQKHIHLRCLNILDGLLEAGFSNCHSELKLIDSSE